MSSDILLPDCAETVSPTPASSQSEASLGYVSEDGSVCYVGLLCDEDPLGQGHQAPGEALEVEVVHDPGEDWMLKSAEGAEVHGQEDQCGMVGMVVDPNTQELVNSSASSVIGCRSYISSTELIESEPSEALESVDKYFHSSPASTESAVSHHAKPVTQATKLIKRPQANTVKRVIVLNPGEDPETATARAISDIADSLNQKAAERLAQGHTPEKETVIEITRIKAPSEGYFSRENILKSQRERLIAGPSQVKAAAQKAPASSAILQARLGNTLLHTSYPSVHLQGQHQQQQQEQQPPHQHHRRKSPHPKKHMYTSPTPPRMPKPARSEKDITDGCYFASTTRIHKTMAVSSSQGFTVAGGQRRLTSQQEERLATAASQATCTFGTHKLTAEGKLSAMTTTYAAPSAKGPTILRSSSTLRQGLPKLNQRSAHVHTVASNTASSTDKSGQLDTSLTNIQWLGQYSAGPEAPADSSTGTQVKVHRDIRIIATERQIDKISRECGRKKRPPYSYMHLIQMAICSRSDKRMTLREIYRWIEEKFPFYKYSANQGWKNSIRHNLSLYDIFVREKHNVPGKSGSSYWTLRADIPTKTSKTIRSMMAERGSSPAEEKSQEIVSSSPAALGKNICAIEDNSVEELPQSTSKVKKGPVPLLPKPPTVAAQGTSGGQGQTYALIPIQNGVPVIPQQPLMVSSWQLGSPQLVLQDQGLAQPGGLSTPQKGFKGNPVSLKRNLSPQESSGGSSRKQVKIAPKINMYSNTLRSRSEEWNSSLKSPSTSSVVSNLGNSLDTSDLQQQFSQIKFDSGIDMHTDISSLSGGTPNSHDHSGASSCSRKGLPRPRIYRNTRSRSSRGSETPPPGERTPSPVDSECEKGLLLPLNEQSPAGAGLHDILASIEKDLSTPMRRLLQTPPKSAEKNLLTSTPFKGVFGSPTWSPIRGLTPINTESAIAAELYTPVQATSKRTSTPFGSSEVTGDRTPEEQSTPNQSSPSARTINLLRGFTPLKSPRFTPDGKSPNTSFTKLLGDIHLDSMIDEGINVDVSNLSFSAFQ